MHIDKLIIAIRKQIIYKYLDTNVFKEKYFVFRFEIPCPFLVHLVPPKCILEIYKATKIDG